MMPRWRGPQSAGLRSDAMAYPEGVKAAGGLVDRELNEGSRHS